MPSRRCVVVVDVGDRASPSRRSPLAAMRSRPRLSCSSAAHTSCVGPPARLEPARFSAAKRRRTRCRRSGSRGRARLEQHGALARRAPPPGSRLDRAAGDRLVGEQVRGAHQHADRARRARPAARPARPTIAAERASWMPPANEHATARSAARRVPRAAARSAPPTATKLVRGPTWPPHSRPSKTKRRAPSREEQRRAARATARAGRSRCPAASSGVACAGPPAGDQRDRRRGRRRPPRAAPPAARRARSRGCRRPTARSPSDAGGLARAASRTSAPRISASARNGRPPPSATACANAGASLTRVIGPCTIGYRMPWARANGASGPRGCRAAACPRCAAMARSRPRTRSGTRGNRWAREAASAAS